MSTPLVPDVDFFLTVFQGVAEVQNAQKLHQVSEQRIVLIDL